MHQFISAIVLLCCNLLSAESSSFFSTQKQHRVTHEHPSNHVHPLNSTSSQCASDDEDYDYVVEYGRSDDKFRFYWRLEESIYGSKPRISIKAVIKKNAWVAVGVASSEDDASYGNYMTGSQAVIGRPLLTGANDEKPLKYDLTDTYITGVTPMIKEKQTLIDPELQQIDGQTILKFKKFLEEDGEHTINSNEMTRFIYAVGRGPSLSFHEHSGVFQLDIRGCPTERLVKFNYKQAWVAHGLFGTLAFAVMIPFTIATAWLRKLLRTSWIYFHVYGNILAGVFTLVCFNIAAITTTVSGQSHFENKHGKVGLTIFIFIMFQVINGVLRPSREARDSQPRLVPKTPRQKWAFVHYLIGFIALIMGLVQVGDGLNMFSDIFNTKNLTGLYFGYIGVVLLIIIVLTFYTFFDFDNKARYGETTGEDLILEESQAVSSGNGIELPIGRHTSDNEGTVDGRDRSAIKSIPEEDSEMTVELTQGRISHEP